MAKPTKLATLGAALVTGHQGKFGKDASALLLDVLLGVLKEPWESPETVPDSALDELTLVLTLLANLDSNLKVPARFASPLAEKLGQLVSLAEHKHDQNRTLPGPTQAALLALVALGQSSVLKETDDFFELLERLATIVDFWSPLGYNILAAMHRFVLQDEGETGAETASILGQWDGWTLGNDLEENSEVVSELQELVENGLQAVYEYCLWTTAMRATHCFVINYFAGANRGFKRVEQLLEGIIVKKLSPVARQVAKLSQAKTNSTAATVSHLVYLNSCCAPQLDPESSALQLLVWCCAIGGHKQLLQSISLNLNPGVWRQLIDGNSYPSVDATSGAPIPPPGAHVKGFAPLLNLVCYGGHSELLEYLLSVGASGNILHDSPQTDYSLVLAPLHIAVQRQSVSCVKALLKYNVNLHIEATAGHLHLQAIEYAATAPNAEILQLLLEKDATLASTKAFGFAIERAAEFGNLEAVKVFVAKGVSHATAGIFPLHAAILGGHDQILEFLLGQGFDVTTPNDDGLTALHMAAFTDRLATLGVILDSKPKDLNFLTKTGQTPLMLAAMAGKAGAVALLLHEGCDPNVVDQKTKQTALHLTLRHYEPPFQPIVEALLEKGANVNAVDGKGHTPLHYAAAQGIWTILRRLVKAGADINAKSPAGLIPLDMCPRVSFALAMAKGPLKQSEQYRPDFEAAAKLLKADVDPMDADTEEESDEEDGNDNNPDINNTISWSQLSEFVASGAAVKALNLKGCRMKEPIHREQMMSFFAMLFGKNPRETQEGDSADEFLPALSDNFCLETFDFPEMTGEMIPQVDKVEKGLDMLLRRNKLLSTPEGKIRRCLMREIADVNRLSDLGLRIGEKVIAVHQCIVRFRWPSYFDEAVQQALTGIHVSKKTMQDVQKFIYGNELPGQALTSTGSILPEDIALAPQAEWQSPAEIFDSLLQLIKIAEAGKWHQLQARLRHHIPLMETLLVKGNKLMAALALATRQRVVPIDRDLDALVASFPVAYRTGQGEDAPNVSQSIKSLFDTKADADIEIVVFDNEGADSPTTTFLAHRAILDCRWPYFSLMLRSNLREQQERRLDLPKPANGLGMTSDLFTALLVYFYTGYVEELRKLALIHGTRIEALLRQGFGQSEELKRIHSDLLAIKPVEEDPTSDDE